jgi:alkylation response protein AidB-like acyl-CoA dehydrogenase
LFSDAFAEFSRSLAAETGEQILTPAAPPKPRAPQVKDADAELKELLAAMKDSDIDFDNIDVDEVTKYANDDEDDAADDEEYEAEVRRQIEEQGQLLARLDEAKKGNLHAGSSTFAVVQEKLRQQQAQKVADDEDGSSADEADLEELYNWRAKGVSKKS